MILFFLGRLLAQQKAYLQYYNKSNTQPTITQVIENQELRPQFDYFTAGNSACSFARLHIIYGDTFFVDQRQAELNLLIIYDVAQNVSYSAINSTRQNHESVSISKIENNGLTDNLTIKHNCSKRQQQGQAIIQLKNKDNNETIHTISYYFYCDFQQRENRFEWGYLILIIFSWGLLFFSSAYAVLYSYGKLSVQLNTKPILAIFVLQIIVGAIVCFSNQSDNQLSNILSIIIGIISISVATTQLLFLSKISFFRISVIKIIRVMDILSLMLAVGVSVLWMYFDKFWVLSDLVSVAACLFIMKLIKLKSLAHCFLLFTTTLAVQIFVTLYFHYFKKTSYSDYLLVNYNSVLMIQFPSITSLLYLKCSWLPSTSMAIVGLLLNYLKRFDKARDTFIYTFIGHFSYLAGSLIWLFITMFSQHSFPFSLFTFSIVFLLVSIFAWKRSQFKIVVKGNFYDEQLQTSSLRKDSIFQGKYDRKLLDGFTPQENHDY